MANCGTSNTPIGPFHTTVRASAIFERNRATDSGPMSRPIWSEGISPAGTTAVAASSLISVDTTTSTGRTISTPDSAAVRR